MEKILKWNQGTNYTRQKGCIDSMIHLQKLSLQPPSTKSQSVHQTNETSIWVVSTCTWYACTAWSIGLTETQTSIIDDLCWQNLSQKRKGQRLGLLRAMHFGDVASPTTSLTVAPNLNGQTVSNRMETEGTKRCKHQMERNILLKSITTDRIKSVAKPVREEWKGVEHYFYVWHIAKGKYTYDDKHSWT